MTDSYNGTFTAADHTKLVNAVLEHPLHGIKYLNVPSGQSPTPLEVADAALKVRSFDAATKERLKAARAAYLQLQTEGVLESETFREGVRKVNDALKDTESIPDMIAALDHLLAEEGIDDHFAAGLKVSKEILTDGADSIYSPDFSAYELMETPTFAGMTGAQMVAHVDVESSPGTGAASAAAAGLASVGAAAVVIYDAFFGSASP
jgi:hypothetical protein